MDIRELSLLLLCVINVHYCVSIPEEFQTPCYGHSCDSRFAFCDDVTHSCNYGCDILCENEYSDGCKFNCGLQQAWKRWQRFICYDDKYNMSVIPCASTKFTVSTSYTITTPRILNDRGNIDSKNSFNNSNVESDDHKIAIAVLALVVVISLATNIYCGWSKLTSRMRSNDNAEDGIRLAYDQTNPNKSNSNLSSSGVFVTQPSDESAQNVQSPAEGVPLLDTSNVSTGSTRNRESETLIENMSTAPGTSSRSGQQIPSRTDSIGEDPSENRDNSTAGQLSNTAYEESQGFSVSSTSSTHSVHDNHGTNTQRFQLRLSEVEGNSEAQVDPLVLSYNRSHTAETTSQASPIPLHQQNGNSKRHVYFSEGQINSQSESKGTSRNPQTEPSRPFDVKIQMPPSVHGPQDGPRNKNKPRSEIYQDGTGT